MAPRWLRDRIGHFPSTTGTAMRKTLPAVALLTLALAACQPQAPSTPATDGSPQDAATAPATEAAAAFAALSKEWLDGWLRPNPAYASQGGDNRTDHRTDAHRRTKERRARPRCASQFRLRRGQYYYYKTQQ